MWRTINVRKLFQLTEFQMIKIGFEKTKRSY